MTVSDEISFPGFKEQICNKISEPWSSFIFFLYFSVVIVMLSTVSIMLPKIFDVNILAVSSDSAKQMTDGFATYFLALFTASSSDVILSKENKASVRFFGFIVVLLSLVICFAVILLNHKSSGSIDFFHGFFWYGPLFSSIFMTMLSWLWWVIANANNDKLMPKEENAAIGGDTKKEFSGKKEGYEI